VVRLCALLCVCVCGVLFSCVVFNFVRVCEVFECWVVSVCFIGVCVCVCVCVVRVGLVFFVCVWFAFAGFFAKLFWCVLLCMYVKECDFCVLFMCVL